MRQQVTGSLYIPDIYHSDGSHVAERVQGIDDTTTRARVWIHVIYVSGLAVLASRAGIHKRF